MKPGQKWKPEDTERARWGRRDWRMGAEAQGYCHNNDIHTQMYVLLLFSRSAVSGSLWPHGLQHTRLPCPSPTPGACSNSCPSSRWCHPTISSSVSPFSSCLQSFPASGSFPVSQFFASNVQSIGVSASASVLLMNIQDVLSFKIEFGNMVQWDLRSYFACE